MKRLVISFLIILMITCSCLCSASVTGDTVSEGIFSYYINEDNTATIVLCSDAGSRNITIPESLGGYKVTEIKGGAFSGSVACEGFKSKNELFYVVDGVLYKDKTLVCYPSGKQNEEFILPRGKNAIESFAFVGNPFLTEVTFNAVAIVPEGCFAGCTKLEKVSLGNVTEIKDSAFAFCESIKEFEFPRSLRIIGEGAFYGCKNLGELKFDDGIEKIGKMAFEKCLSVTEICVPANVTNVEEWIFSISPELKTVSVSKNNKLYKVNDNILYSGDKCSTLVFCPPGSDVTEVVVPEYVYIIGRNAFENHKTLKKIVLSDKVQAVGSHAFYGCSVLETAVLNDGLEKIGNYAFFGCEKIGDVKVYSSVAEVGNGAFENCPGINLLVAGGSCGYQYADENNVNFTIDLDQEPVEPGYWADRYIKWAEENEVIEGDTDYKVPINREGCSWLVVNFYESITGQEAEIPETPFSDTDSPAVCKAYGLGILNGMGDKTFNPIAPITRQELCVCLVKLVKLLEGELPQYSESVVFRDSDMIADWAKTYVDDAYKGGIITGFPDGSIVPTGSATIEETVVMLYNVAGVLN